MANSLSVRVTSDALRVGERPFAIGRDLTIPRSAVRQLGVVEYTTRVDGWAETSRYGLAASLAPGGMKWLMMGFRKRAELEPVEHAVEDAWNIEDDPSWVRGARAGLPPCAEALGGGDDEIAARVGKYAISVRFDRATGQPYREAPRVVSDSQGDDMAGMTSITVRDLPQTRLFVGIAVGMVILIMLFGGIIALATGLSGLWQALPMLGFLLAGSSAMLIFGGLWDFAAKRARPVVLEIDEKGLRTPQRAIDRGDIARITCILVRSTNKYGSDRRPLVVESTVGEQIVCIEHLEYAGEDALDWLLGRLEQLLKCAVVRSADR